LSFLAAHKSKRTRHATHVCGDQLPTTFSHANGTRLVRAVIRKAVHKWSLLVWRL